MFRTRLPLRPHHNPQYAHNYSLGAFLYSFAASYPLLQRGFQKAITRGCLAKRPPVCSVNPPAPRKAGYTVHSILPHTGLILRSNPYIDHPVRSPRRTGQRPHAIADRPAFLTPSIDPRLGVESQHQKLHRCALKRIFRPVFRNGITD